MADGAKIIQRKIDASVAANLPVAEIVTGGVGGRIINVEKPLEETVQEVSTESHYNPETGKIEGMVPQSDQKKAEAVAAERNKQRQDEKRDRYAGEKATWIQDPGGRAAKLAGEFITQVFRREKLENAQQEPTQPKTFLGRMTASVNKIGLSQNKPQVAEDKEQNQTSRIAEKTAEISTRVGDARSVGIVTTAAVAAKNFFSNFLERKESKPQHVEFAQNTVKFAQKTSDKTVPTKPSMIFNPRGSGVIKNTVSPSSNLGMGARAAVGFKNAANPLNIFNIFDILSRSGTSVIRLFQGASAASSGVFFAIFLAVIFVPMGVLVFMQTMKQTAFVQLSDNNSRVAAGLPAPAVSINKTSKLNADGSINYTVNITELKPVTNKTVIDVVKIIDKNGTRTLPQRSFAYSPSINYTLPNPGVTDAIIVNTVTVAGVSASSQIIIGNPPITAFSCPVVGGKISLGSQTATGGHCGPNYPLLDACPGQPNYWPGNEKAIDVSGSVNQQVYFPAIDGKQVSWQLVREGNDLNYTFNGATQKFREFKAVGIDYVLQVHHLIDDNLLAGKTTFNSGEVLGKMAGFDGNVSSPHSHIQIQRAGIWTAADDPTLKFCQ